MLMNMRHLAQLFFWICFLGGVSGFFLCLYKYIQLEDTEITELDWQIPGKVEVFLESGKYRIWLPEQEGSKQKLFAEKEESAAQTGEIVDFQDYWFAGMTLAGHQLTEPEKTGVYIHKISGANTWANQENRVSVGWFELAEAADVELYAVQRNEHYPAVTSKLILAKACFEQQDALLKWMMVSLVGGTVLAIMGAALLIGFSVTKKRE